MDQIWKPWEAGIEVRGIELGIVECRSEQSGISKDVEWYNAIIKRGIWKLVKAKQKLWKPINWSREFLNVKIESNSMREVEELA